jgi:hypothetical protein
MELVSKAADSMAQGDLVEKGVRIGMKWGLFTTAAVLRSVVPGDYICQVGQECSKNYFINIITEGFLTGQIQFCSLLGKNSKKYKVDRILQELLMHTRLRLRDHIV